jgi:hypothetical protein
MGKDKEDMRDIGGEKDDDDDDDGISGGDDGDGTGESKDVDNCEKDEIRDEKEVGDGDTREAGSSGCRITPGVASARVASVVATGAGVFVAANGDDGVDTGVAPAAGAGAASMDDEEASVESRFIAWPCEGEEEVADFTCDPKPHPRSPLL